MTESISTDFEDGTPGSPYTLNTLANGSAANCTTAVAAHGTKAVVELGTAGYGYTQANFSVTKTTCRIRYAMAQDTALTADGIDLEVHSDTTNFGATSRTLQVVRKNTSFLRVLDSAGATVHSFTNTIPTDSSFIVVELQIVCGVSANATINGRIYTNAAPGTILDSFTTSTFTTLSAIQSVHLGKVTTAAYTPSTGKTYHDIFAVDDGSSGFIGPFPTAGWVLGGLLGG